jgi:hypothetical protein
MLHSESHTGNKRLNIVCLIQMDESHTPYFQDLFLRAVDLQVVFLPTCNGRERRYTCLNCFHENSYRGRNKGREHCTQNKAMLKAILLRMKKAISGHDTAENLAEQDGLSSASASSAPTLVRIQPIPCCCGVRHSLHLYIRRERDNK